MLFLSVNANHGTPMQKVQEIISRKEASKTASSKTSQSTNDVFHVLVTSKQHIRTDQSQRKYSWHQKIIQM